MPHISSKKLNQKILEELFDKLFSILSKGERKGLLSSVVNELVTSTEKIMIAKRLAIILMLTSNIPHERVAQVLQVSPTTVSKMSLKVEIGKYKSILKVSQKEKVDIEKLIWNILTVGGIMPPKVGRRYWITVP